MSESGKVDTALEQLLVLISAPSVKHEMLRLIDLNELREQLRPALDVLRFGGKVVGPTEAEVLEACSLDGTSITILENSDWKPLVALAAAIEKLDAERYPLTAPT